MNPYELEAWAFALPIGERAQAFLIVADALEDSNDLKGAEVRRSWSRQLELDWVPDLRKLHSSWEGHFWLMESVKVPYGHDLLEMEGNQMYQVYGSTYSSFSAAAWILSDIKWYYSKFKHEPHLRKKQHAQSL